ncbi:Methyltransferase type 11 [Penicillium freii]|nr:Methyltransferase type 11 [Penicillium freii]
MASDYRTAEKTTLPYAIDLVKQSGVASTAGQPLAILDQACGTGVVAVALHDALGSQSEKDWCLTCTDVSISMVAAIQERIEKNGWENTDAAVSDILKTGFPEDQYTHIFGAFIFMALPDSQAALDEALRILKPGGTIGIVCWGSFGWIDHVNAAAALLPGNLPQISTEDFMRAMGDGRWEDPTWVKTQFQNRGLNEVQVTSVGKTIAQGISEVSALLKGPLNFIKSRFWTEKQRQQSGAQFAPALAQHLEDLYGKGNQMEINSTGIIATGRLPH